MKQFSDSLPLPSPKRTYRSPSPWPILESPLRDEQPKSSSASILTPGDSVDTFDNGSQESLKSEEEKVNCKKVCCCFSRSEIQALIC